MLFRKSRWLGCAFSLLLAGWISSPLSAQSPISSSMPCESEPEWVQSCRAVLSPNMFGDIPGSRPLTVRCFQPDTPGTRGAPEKNLLLGMPNPAAGGLVGRNKVSTDNNPMPRDRLIFNYDVLNRTPLTEGGLDINRFSFGFEKSFFDGMGSVEVRLPFASTVNTNAADGFITSGGALLGNLFVTFKVLGYSCDTWALSGGLALAIPTAEDTRLRINGSDLVRIENDSVYLTPFVAALFTPTDEIFSQAWAAIDFDTSGNPVRARVNDNGLATIGRLHDPFLLQLDWQIGYWLIHPSDPVGELQGLAGFFEMHYNTTLQNGGAAQAGPITGVDSLATYSEYYLSAGLTAQFLDDLYLTGGVTVPMLTGNDRFGDYQIGLRLSWFFGATSAARAAAISNF